MHQEFDRDEFAKMHDYVAETSVYAVGLEPAHIGIFTKEIEKQIIMYELNSRRNPLTEIQRENLFMAYSIRERLHPLMDNQEPDNDTQRHLGLTPFEMKCTNNWLLTMAALMKNPDINQQFTDGLGGKVYSETMGLFLSLNKGFIIAGGPMLPEYKEFMVNNQEES